MRRRPLKCRGKRSDRDLTGVAWQLRWRELIWILRTVYCVDVYSFGKGGRLLKNGIFAFQNVVWIMWILPDRFWWL